jgi:hypothetical protein
MRTFYALEKFIGGNSDLLSKRRCMALAQKVSNEMGIRTVLHSEFDRLLPHHPILERFMAEQVGWFSNPSGNLLGTIAGGRGVKSWNYAILKRDTRGEFHVRKVMTNFSSLTAARVCLLLSMARIEKLNDAILMAV